MHRKALIVGLAAGAALLTAAVALASGGELTEAQTIHVTERGGQVTFLPLNTNKNTFAGDEVVVTGPVFRATGNVQVGRQHAVCTLVDTKGIVGECTITTFLKAGAIVASGPVHFGVNDRTTGAITGGTGEFRNARGQVTFINSTGPTEGFVFDLEP